MSASIKSASKIEYIQFFDVSSHFQSKLSSKMDDGSDKAVNGKL